MKHLKIKLFKIIFIFDIHIFDMKVQPAKYKGYSIMYKTKVLDLGYNRLFYIIEYSH